MLKAIKRYLLQRKIQRYTEGGQVPTEVLNRIMQINGLNKMLLNLIEGKMITREDHQKRVCELLRSNNVTLAKYRYVKKKLEALEKKQ